MLAALLLISAAIGSQEEPTAALPGAAHCAALFAFTYDNLKGKSGDPAMTRGFAEDAAALRAIVIAQAKGENAEAAADRAIAAERLLVEAGAQQRQAKGDETPVDLKPCYRVKALGPRGE